MVSLVYWNLKLTFNNYLDYDTDILIEFQR